jgi:PPM family protein phosphatase
MTSEMYSSRSGEFSQDNGDAVDTAPPLTVMSPALNHQHAAVKTLAIGSIVGGRYRIDEFVRAQLGVQRYRGVDLQSNPETPMPIALLCQISGGSSEAAETGEDWPTIAWEKRVLARSSHLTLPRVLDSFEQDERTFLIEEQPEGRSFWDAWDDTPVSWPRRCGWLIQLAEAIERLYHAGAMLELNPQRVVITSMEHVVISDLSTLLPLPVPEGEPAVPSRNTAPELLLGKGTMGGRAAMYSFGAMIQSLLLGRELSDFDFTPIGKPRPYVERFPDAHPLLARLLGRTFAFNPSQRFPGPDRLEDDPSGARELIELLQVCSRNLDAIRLEISAWTSTGLVRSENEDAVAVLHSAESGLEENDDFALLVLADGMGGMAGGEIAAAMTIQIVRDYFLKHPPITDLHLAAQTPPADDTPPAEKPSHTQVVMGALREANRVVLERSLAEQSLRGMGCTAEVVLIDGQKVHIGHVGDSRTYHYRRGKLTQVTQDQTLVTRMVMLGQLTETEAETHPQRSELQQAIGGRGDVYPDEYNLMVESGDWLLVCTDGLSNMLRPLAITDVLQSAGSAEKAARRLVNQAILAGGGDNVSLIAVRVC